MKNHLLTPFYLPQKLFHNVLDGFTDEETNRRLNEDKKINHVKYIAGHLVNTQYVFALLADVTMERKWDDLFAGMGQTKAKDDIAYPTTEQLNIEWDAIYNKTGPALEKLTERDLNCTPPKPLDSIFQDDPIVDNTIGSVWAFFNHHQAYHIGQIGILRRGFDKPPMRYD